MEAFFEEYQNGTTCTSHHFDLNNDFMNAISHKYSDDVRTDEEELYAEFDKKNSVPYSKKIYEKIIKKICHHNGLKHVNYYINNFDKIKNIRGIKVRGENRICVLTLCLNYIYCNLNNETMTIHELKSQIKRNISQTKIYCKNLAKILYSICNRLGIKSCTKNDLLPYMEKCITTIIYKMKNLNNDFGTKKNLQVQTRTNIFDEVFELINNFTDNYNDNDSFYIDEKKKYYNENFDEIDNQEKGVLQNNDQCIYRRSKNINDHDFDDGKKCRASVTTGSANGVSINEDEISSEACMYKCVSACGDNSSGNSNDNSSDNSNDNLNSLSRYIRRKRSVNTRSKMVRQDVDMNELIKYLEKNVTLLSLYSCVLYSFFVIWNTKENMDMNLHKKECRWNGGNLLYFICSSVIITFSVFNIRLKDQFVCYCLDVVQQSVISQKREMLNFFLVTLNEFLGIPVNTYKNVLFCIRIIFSNYIMLQMYLFYIIKKYKLLNRKKKGLLFHIQQLQIHLAKLFRIIHTNFYNLSDLIVDYNFLFLSEYVYINVKEIISKNYDFLHMKKLMKDLIKNYLTQEEKKRFDEHHFNEVYDIDLNDIKLYLSKILSYNLYNEDEYQIDEHVQKNSEVVDQLKRKNSIILENSSHGSSEIVLACEEKTTSDATWDGKRITSKYAADENYFSDNRSRMQNGNSRTSIVVNKDDIRNNDSSNNSNNDVNSYEIMQGYTYDETINPTIYELHHGYNFYNLKQNNIDIFNYRKNIMLISNNTDCRDKGMCTYLRSGESSYEVGSNNVRMNSLHTNNARSNLIDSNNNTGGDSNLRCYYRNYTSKIGIGKEEDEAKVTMKYQIQDDLQNEIKAGIGNFAEFLEELDNNTLKNEEVLLRFFKNANILKKINLSTINETNMEIMRFYNIKIVVQFLFYNILKSIIYNCYSLNFFSLHNLHRSINPRKNVKKNISMSHEKAEIINTSFKRKIASKIKEMKNKKYKLEKYLICEQNDYLQNFHNSKLFKENIKLFLSDKKIILKNVSELLAYCLQEENADHSFSLEVSNDQALNFMPNSGKQSLPSNMRERDDNSSVYGCYCKGEECTNIHIKKNSLPYDENNNNNSSNNSSGNNNNYSSGNNNNYNNSNSNNSSGNNNNYSSGNNNNYNNSNSNNSSSNNNNSSNDNNNYNNSSSNNSSGNNNNYSSGNNNNYNNSNSNNSSYYRNYTSKIGIGKEEDEAKVTMKYQIQDDLQNEIKAGIGNFAEFLEELDNNTLKNEEVLLRFFKNANILKKINLSTINETNMEIMRFYNIKIVVQFLFYNILKSIIYNCYSLNFFSLHNLHRSINPRKNVKKNISMSHEKAEIINTSFKRKIASKIKEMKNKKYKLEKYLICEQNDYLQNFHNSKLFKENIKLFLSDKKIILKNVSELLAYCLQEENADHSFSLEVSNDQALNFMPNSGKQSLPSNMRERDDNSSVYGCYCKGEECTNIHIKKNSLPYDENNNNNSSNNSSGNNNNYSSGNNNNYNNSNSNNSSGNNNNYSSGNNNNYNNSNSNNSSSNNNNSSNDNNNYNNSSSNNSSGNNNNYSSGNNNNYNNSNSNNSSGNNNNYNNSNSNNSSSNNNNSSSNNKKKIKIVLCRYAAEDENCQYYNDLQDASFNFFDYIFNIKMMKDYKDMEGLFPGKYFNVLFKMFNNMNYSFGSKKKKLIKMSNCLYHTYHLIGIKRIAGVGYNFTFKNELNDNYSKVLKTKFSNILSLEDVYFVFNRFFYFLFIYIKSQCCFFTENDTHLCTDNNNALHSPKLHCSCNRANCCYKIKTIVLFGNL
ncbi:conserved Plasmodium protein, unknown function [Plasmodium malariae]|uniref:Uncharacterized protein n=1 Tax=Plasmodium malariae TaxID=5858 RepID=A0A1C3KYE0_PLAMA|nr:conserved Plasmodium protein, unknown function [Plasmodium malariae]